MTTLSPSKALSASRIKMLQSCSWQYFCRYHISLPDTTNSGAQRGTVCHLVFELLLEPRHRNHYNLIIEANSIVGSKAINRLIKKHVKKVSLTEEDYQLIDEMILVGLKHDFYCKGGEIVEPEYKFTIENESPKYKITGFIDKPVIYKKEGIISIKDYKSSKKRFSGEDLEVNVQAMLYSLAAKSLWPDLKPVVEFIFLRFPKKPIQQLEFSDAQLRGFAITLEKLNEIINKFSEKDAKSNFAADKDGMRWLCKAGATYECPFYRKFAYFAVVDSEGKILKTAFNKNELKAQSGQTVMEKQYDGCPRHAINSDNEKQTTDDPFDF